MDPNPPQPGPVRRVGNELPWTANSPESGFAIDEAASTRGQAGASGDPHGLHWIDVANWAPFLALKVPRERTGSDDTLSMMQARLSIALVALLTACADAEGTEEFENFMNGAEWSGSGGGTAADSGGAPEAPLTGGAPGAGGMMSSGGAAEPPVAGAAGMAQVTGGASSGGSGGDDGAGGDALPDGGSDPEDGGANTGGASTGGTSTGGSAGMGGATGGAAGCVFPFPCETGGTGAGGAAGAGASPSGGAGGLFADFSPAPDNPAECPAEAPENPWGPCAGLPVYLACNYTDGTRNYGCICDWIHWICI